MSLYLARRFLEPLAGTYFSEAANQAISKIRAGLGRQAIKYIDQMAGAIHLTFPGIGRYSDKAVLIDQLTFAIEEHRVTLLAYQSERSTEPVTREIHPYAWVFHRNSPYLVAFATEHREVRLYKADRIHDVEVSQLHFPRPTNFDPAEYLAGSFGVYRGQNDHPINIHVKFLPPVVQYVNEKQWHPTQKLTPHRDGSLIAEFQLSTTAEIKRWLLSFGSNAVVLEPKSLCEEIASELNMALAGYEGTPPSTKRRRLKK